MQIKYYDASGQDKALSAKDLPRVRLKSDSLLWINGTAEELAGLTFPKLIAPAVACDPAPLGLVQVHDTFYSLTVPVLSHAHDGPWDDLVLIVGQDWLISRGIGKAIEFDHLLAEEVGETLKGKLSGSSLAVALIVDHFSRVHARISVINREVDEIEERILTGNERSNTLQVMAVLRRQVSRLRTLVDSYRGIITAVTRPDFLPEIEEIDRQHFLHLLAVYERLEDEVAHLRESVVASFELYATRVTQDTNRLLRTLTYLTIGIGLIGALAGVFGMNFEVALFEQGSGFYLSSAVMVVILAVTGAIALYSYRRP